MLDSFFKAISLKQLLNDKLTSFPWYRKLPVRVKNQQNLNLLSGGIHTSWLTNWCSGCVVGL